MSTNYYELLGVTSTAQTQTIRKAYLEKARQWHPDNFGDTPPSDAQKQMQRLNEAWQCLRDDASRAAYDRQQASKIQRQNVIRVTNDFSTVRTTTQHRRQQEEARTQKQKKSFRKLLITFAALAGAALVAFSFLSTTPEESNPAALPSEVNLGANIAIGDCVSVQTGPSLLEVPCDRNATGRIFSVAATCAPDAQELTLQNEVTICLIAV